MSRHSLSCQPPFAFNAGSPARFAEVTSRILDVKRFVDFVVILHCLHFCPQHLGGEQQIPRRVQVCIGLDEFP